MAEETKEAISAAKPPVLNPIGSPASTHAATLKLKPIIRKPAPGMAALPKAGIKLPTPAKPVPATPAGAAPIAAPVAAPKDASATAKLDGVAPIDNLKAMTQKLKGVTQQLPAQAILHKTGIIADSALTEAQKQASKSRTARISLSDAIGAAPVKNDAKPMKTIRIKRPIDIPGGATAEKSNVVAAPVVAEPAAAAPVVAKPAAEKPAEETLAAPAATPATVTQKKTLKIARPGVAGGRPAPKFGVKKPNTSTTTMTKISSRPAASAEGADGTVADIADIPDIPDMPAAPVAAASAGGVQDVPKAVAFLSLAVQIAACAAMGFLAWQLYQDYLLPAFVGGCQFQ